jgi:hypothetical protein
MKVVVLGLLVLFWQSVPTLGLAAPKSAAGQKAAANSAAQKAMDECAAQYCGRRSASVSGNRPLLIEGCFHQKTGKYPAQMGVAFPSHCAQETHINYR